MGVYACGKCKFLFERVSPVEHCPDCGRDFVREATPAEEAKYRGDREQTEKEERIN